MPAKVCPRCGALYQTLKSSTCPQCFAPLVIVDEETAAELINARAEIESSPEYQAAEAADNEEFREQSFQAVFGVALVALVTIIFIVVLIGFARHRQARISQVRPASVSRTSPASSDILSMLPVAAASLDEVLPAQVGTYQRLVSDQEIVLPGTFIHLDHARYQGPGPKKAAFDVYALPAGTATPQQNNYRLGLSLAAQTHGSAPPLFFATQYWLYAAIAPASGDEQNMPQDFRNALAQLFRQP